MKNSAEYLHLRQAYLICQTHAAALADAINDLMQRKLLAADLEHLSKDDRRLIDQFAYRYTRLQDDMGARLIPATLRALGEDISAMPVLDRLIRMEQLGWLPDAEQWGLLRRVSNEFTHDYPETLVGQFERLQLARDSAQTLMVIFHGMSLKIQQRFPTIAE